MLSGMLQNFHTLARAGCLGVITIKESGGIALWNG
jgi:hypothetical protein